MDLTTILIILAVLFFLRIYFRNSKTPKKVAHKREVESTRRREKAYLNFESERMEKEQNITSIVSSYFKEISNLETDTDVQNIQKELDKLSKIPKASSHDKGKYLFFDTETTGLPRLRNVPPEDFSNWPYIVEIAWLLIDEEGLQAAGGNYIVKQNVSIPKEATAVHHITTQEMLLKGIPPKDVYSEFIECVEKAEYIIAHNLEFDMPIIECELLRNGFNKILFSKKQYCTMKGGRDFCTVYDRAGRIKNPKLSELFGDLYFDNPYLKFEGTHNALADTNMVHRCFMKMIELEPSLLEKSSYTVQLPTVHNEQSPKIEPAVYGDSIPMIADEDLILYFGDECFKNVQVLVTGVAKEDKEECWNMITELNGKVVKSVTKNLSVVVLGPAPGWKKIEDIKLKIQSGDRIIGITDIQLQILYEKLK